MSFWRTFGFHSISAVEQILDREHFTLEELLEEEDLLQEAKAGNKKLVDYLGKSATAARLVDFLATEPGENADTKRRYKFPFVSCELIVADVPSLVDAIGSQPAVLGRLWEWVWRETPPPAPMLQLLTKAAAFMLQKRPQHCLTLLRERPGFIGALLRHLHSPCVSELLLKMVQAEDAGLEGLSEWLLEERFLERVVDLLAPENNPDTHELAAQAVTDIVIQVPGSNLVKRLEEPVLVKTLLAHATTRRADGSQSNLLAGMSVLIAMLRRWARDAPETATGLEALPGFLLAIVDALPALKALLGEAPAGPLELSVGPVVPVGFARLRLAEFFQALVRTYYVSLADLLLRLSVLQTLCDMLFAYPWNNFLHQQAAETLALLLAPGVPGALRVSMVSALRLHERLAAAGLAWESAPLSTGALAYYLALSARLLDAAAQVPELDALLAASENWAAYLEHVFRPQRQLEETPLGGGPRWGGQDALGNNVILHEGPDEGDQDEDSDGLSSENVFRSFPAQQGFVQDFPEDFNRDEDYDDEDADVSFDPEEDALSGGANRAVQQALRPPTPLPATSATRTEQLFATLAHSLDLSQQQQQQGQGQENSETSPCQEELVQPSPQPPPAADSPPSVEQQPAQAPPAEQLLSTSPAVEQPPPPAESSALQQLSAQSSAAEQPLPAADSPVVEQPPAQTPVTEPSSPSESPVVEQSPTQAPVAAQPPPAADSPVVEQPPAQAPAADQPPTSDSSAVEQVTAQTPVAEQLPSADSPVAEPPVQQTEPAPAEALKVETTGASEDQAAQSSLDEMETY